MKLVMKRRVAEVPQTVTSLCESSQVKESNIEHTLQLKQTHSCDAMRAPGKNGPRKKRTIRRTAGQIAKEFHCFFCEKMYGSEAAAIMHMRNKH